MTDSVSTSALRLLGTPADELRIAAVGTSEVIRVGRGSSAPGTDAARAVHPKIDMHQHFCAPQWRDWAAHHELINPERLPPWSRFDIGDAIRFMDDAGITTAVLKPMLPARYRSSAQLREAVNITLQSMVEVAQSHPGRFSYYVPLFLDDPEASSWAVRRGLGQLGAVGVNVTANYGGVYLGDPAYDRLFHELNEFSAVVDTHPHNLPDTPPGVGGPPGAPTVPGIPNFMCDFLLDTTRAAVNMISRRTLDRFPDISVVLPHAGGFLPYIATRLQALGRFCEPRVEPAAVRDHLSRFYYDTAGPMAPAATLLEHVPADHILFGTDWPAAPADTVMDLALPALEADPAFTPEQLRGVYHDNAMRLIPQLATA
ncbi:MULTISPECIES: amidohydrolase family protein [Streptomyces]|uniref:Amidohydrolase n=1 Tax=Streptomyces spororaveus TaxID=284039 RepID=A0ABQ3T9F1_9ACTN|nr:MULTISPECIES: amidohydrolase family protein [Streptomyces]MCM9082577.1 amidohydrolase [Streptomyces spororaveus]MCX5302657.1 amidohydrolase [Streptomyces sp. NBC_00160]GHI77002.1 amidohydrolase [Streptomyces spororaveus]